MLPEIKDLLNQSIASGLYPTLVRQINKDFLRAGLDEEFTEDYSAASLSRNLTAVVYELIVSDFEAYLNLLYTIDIPENRIKSLPEQRVDELAVSVSGMILNRELQKVRFRESG